MRMNRIEVLGALKDNYEIWRVVLPILVGGFFAGLAIIEFALNDPFVFLGWSLTCSVAGGFAYRWWSRRVAEAPAEWS
jgi:hypothetical protein